MNREELFDGISADDVWGKCTDPMKDEVLKRLTNGMLVARGLPFEIGDPEATRIMNNSDDKPLPMVCPIWNDKVPYKSVTVVCEEKNVNAAIHWLSYVHGGEYSRCKNLGGGKFAIRSDYQCW